MKAVSYILVVCLVFGLASKSRAAATFGVAVMDANGNIISADKAIKTPPLRTSDTFRVVIDKHFAPMIPPVNNWAGYRVKFHILDGTEISVLPTSVFYGTDVATTPMGDKKPVIVASSPLTPPGFPQSTPAQSVSVFKTWFVPGAQLSGKTPPESKWIPMAAIDLHAKNTHIGQNSDVDMTVMAWCIRHLGQGQGSTQFEHSALVWATPNFQPTPIQPIPSHGPEFNDLNARWVHIPFDWHLQPGGFGSQFIATLMGTVTIGLEHVPEPLSGLLAGSGALSLLGSRGLRRRRLRG